MNYIINPSVFYWINVVDGLKNVAVLALILGCVGVFTCIVIYIADHDYLDEDETNTLKKTSKVVVPAFISGLLGVIFIPDKQTLIEMLIAKTATVDNAEWTLDALKQAVDYIVAAMK